MCLQASALHPEAGKVWEWQEQHLEDIYERMGANLDGDGTGALRRIPQHDLDELQRIFDITGATERIDTINKYSMQKAQEMGLTEEEYFMKVFTETEKDHLNQ